MNKRSRRVKQYWDPTFGDRRLLKRCVTCSATCKVSLPVGQKEEDLCGSIQCARTGFQYTPGPTNAPERNLDFSE